jgi:hypothetical protein
MGAEPRADAASMGLLRLEYNAPAGAGAESKKGTAAVT